MSVADALVLEGPGATLDFVVSLSHVSDQAVTVTYRTENGTGNGVALPTSDYHAASGRLTFDAGETEQTVSVRVREDEEQDGQETLTLLLTSAVGATFADAEATGTILNTPKGERRPAYYGHDRPDWSPGQIYPTSITSTEDHTIDVAWASPISYIPYRFRVNFAPVDPEVAASSFPWEGAGKWQSLGSLPIRDFHEGDRSDRRGRVQSASTSADSGHRGNAGQEWTLEPHHGR